jgi:hypothetical protein
MHTFLLEALYETRGITPDEITELIALGSVYTILIGIDTHYLVPRRKSAQGLRNLYPDIRPSRIWSFPTLREVNRILGVEDNTFLRTILAWDQGLGVDDDATIRDAALSVIPPTLARS